MSEVEQLNALVGNLVILMKIGGSVGGLGALYGLVAVIRAWRGKDEQRQEPQVSCAGALSEAEKTRLIEIHAHQVEDTQINQNVLHELTKLTNAVERLVQRIDH